MSKLQITNYKLQINHKHQASRDGNWQLANSNPLLVRALKFGLPLSGIWDLSAGQRIGILSSEGAI